MRPLRVSALAVAALLLLGTAAGCGDSADLTIYSGRNETLVKPLIKKFEKASGLSVKVRYGDTAQMAAQLTEEGAKSPAQVFFAQDAGALGAVSAKGLLADLPDATLAKVPVTYRSSNRQWVGVSGRARVLAYNPTLVPAARLPTSVLAMTGPQFKDRIGIAPTNGSFQAFVTALRVQHGDARAQQFLAGLKANGAQIRANNIAIIDDIAAGRLAVGLINHYYLFEKAHEAGKPADQMPVKLHYFAAGDTGSLVNVAGVGVLKAHAADPNAAKFVDYLLGAEAQEYFANRTFEYPLSAGVPTAPGLRPLASIVGPKIDLNNLSTLDATVKMITAAGLA